MASDRDTPRAPALTEDEIEALQAERRKLRAECQWGAADAIRGRLTALGIEVRDAPARDAV